MKLSPVVLLVGGGLLAAGVYLATRPSAVGKDVGSAVGQATGTLKVSCVIPLSQLNRDLQDAGVYPESVWSNPPVAQISSTIQITNNGNVPASYALTITGYKNGSSIGTIANPYTVTLQPGASSSALAGVWNQPLNPGDSFNVQATLTATATAPDGTTTVSKTLAGYQSNTVSVPNISGSATGGFSTFSYDVGL